MASTPTESNPLGSRHRRTSSSLRAGAGLIPQLKCRGMHRICHHFYDTPPAGRFGTMSYMVRALTHIIGDSLPVAGASGKIAVNCAVA